MKAGQCTVIPEWGLPHIYNLTSVHLWDIRGENAHADLMSSYIIMRTDYMRIPQSSRHDQTQSIKHLRPESPHIDGGSEYIPNA